MRSTIFISTLLLAGHAVAQNGPTFGCFARDYGTDHLAAHPDQIVARMVAEIGPAMEILPDQTGWEDLPESTHRQPWMRLAVWTANQGHVSSSGRGGQRFDQYLVCGGGGCGVECDGGSMRFERYDGRVLQFHTDYLSVGEHDGCGGVIDLAERPGQAVSYRLERVEDAICGETFKPSGD